MALTAQTILVTGGTGYIGSHTVVQLLDAGHRVVILDNLSNSKRVVVNRIERITGKRPEFVMGDIRDHEVLRSAFAAHKIDAVIHFAGLKAVGETEVQPLKYYANNVSGSVTLAEEMARAGVKTMIFSSSAAVYGDPGVVHYTEDLPVKPVNVYGRTKLMVENVLRDLKKSDSEWRIALLRYSTAMGAHDSGLIGEDPRGISNNLMPFVSQVAVSKHQTPVAFTKGCPAPDSTGKRDYIHVDDLAGGHLAALNVLNDSADTLTINLGMGCSHRVPEVVDAFGQPMPYDIAQGDLTEYSGEPSLAKRLLGWEARHGIERICEDTLRWQANNPLGYVPDDVDAKRYCRT